MADYSIKENIEKSVWNACIENSKQGTVFLNPDFVDSLSVKYKTFLVLKGNEPVAGCMVLVDDEGKPLHSPYPFVPYQGFFFIDRGEEATNKTVSRQFDITEFLINHLIALYGTVSLTHFRLTDYRPFMWHNYHTPEKGLFQLTMNYTPILALDCYATLEEYLMSVRAVRRQEYKKTIESGIKVVDSQDVELLCRLHNLTFQRQGITQDPLEEKMVSSITQSALKNGYGKLRVAYIDDKPASAIVFLHDKKRGYYMFGANDPDHRKSFASTLLLVDSIWKCKQAGLKEVDFVGCNSPHRGDYKLSFNGELTPYFETQFKGC